MEARHLLKMLKDEGWYLGETAGASRQYVHKDLPGRITVCVRYTDRLGPETLASAQAPGGPRPGPQQETILEATSSGYSAYSPGLPGCVATGATEAEARERMDEAMALHRQELTGT